MGTQEGSGSGDAEILVIVLPQIYKCPRAAQLTFPRLVFLTLKVITVMQQPRNEALEAGL